MIRVYPEQPSGQVKPLHGVNLGPIDMNWSLDFSDAFKRLAIPSVRLHDASHTCLDVADLHCIFPSPLADPNDPENYFFEQTDDYLNAIRATGADIYFRLGETLEHQPRKKYVEPERWGSPEQLASVCAHIVRHYNDGWANGFQWGIRHWEFWNEPDLDWMNRPESRRCWTGTPERFLDFYRAAVREIKGVDRSLMVGLAGFASHGFAVSQDEEPDSPPHPYRAALQHAMSDGVPIDFVSWHRYLESWDDMEVASRQVRHFMDEGGLKEAQSYLTEWAYLPALPDGGTLFTARRDRNYDQIAQALELMNGAQGAAFIFGALARLQELTVDLAHFYTGIASMRFGLFQPHTGLPKKSIAGFETFNRFLGGQRMRVESDEPNKVGALAASDGGKLRIGIAHLDPTMKETTVRIESAVAPTSVARARQYTDSGWRDISTSVVGDGNHTISLAGAGITMLEWL